MAETINHNRLILSKDYNNSQFLTPFNNPNYTSFLIEYLPGIEEEIINHPDTAIYILDSSFAILLVKTKNFQQIVGGIKNIVNISLDGIYCPNEISPSDTTKANLFHVNPYFTLNGSGVLVGIIDSGIDYLNKEFIKEDNTTRILSIWDQTEKPAPTEPNLFYGSVYTSNEINNAIKLASKGGDPYSIVPHKDLSGHGTMVASVLGARGKDRNLEGIAPDCTFAIVKLHPACKTYTNLFCIKSTNYTYKNDDILLAINYLNELSLKHNLPLVVCIPLGSNLGAHDGNNVLERYIDKLSIRRGIVFATSTGNEGNTDTHTQGIISKVSPIQTIELNIAKSQASIFMRIYITIPGSIQISITSPSGESTNLINSKMASSDSFFSWGVRNYFTYENSSVYVSFSSPDYITGDDKIDIKAKNLKPGIWKFNLHTVIPIDTRYDAWIPQRVLLEDDTKFLNPVNYTTLQSFSSCNSIISTSFYNQNNNSVVVESGRGFTRNKHIAPIITAPGVNILVTTPGGKNKIASGGSLAAAVVSGICALLLQWGIVNGNNIKLYSVNLRSYLIRGAIRSSISIYPNPEWGYGIVDIEGIFNSIRDITSSFVRSSYFNIGKCKSSNRTVVEYYLKELFIRNPY